jgi:hypothetical protein
MQKEALHKSTKNLLSPPGNSPSTDKDESVCLYCNELHSLSPEVWVACRDCRKWALVSWAREDEEDVISVGGYLCILCGK